MGPTPAKVGRIKARDTQTTSPDPCPLCVNFNQSWHPEVYTNNGLGSVTRIGACFGGLDHRSWCDPWQRLRILGRTEIAYEPLVLIPGQIASRMLDLALPENLSWDQREGVLIPDSLAGRLRGQAKVLTGQKKLKKR